MKVDPRFLTSDGPEVFNGNELLLKGALETEGGCHLLGGYPGSPVAAYFDSMAHIKDLLVQKGIRACINTNEALAAAMLNGSQTIGLRTLIGMKSVGVHVAADGLAMGNLSGSHPDGGAIVATGDDPWSDSTQSPSDSRYIFRHLFIPVVEPSDAQEVKDFIDLSFKLSRMSELFAGYIISTNLADGGGSVICRPNQFPKVNTNQRIALDTGSIDTKKRVLLPPNSWAAEESLSGRLARAVDAARTLGLNKILFPSEATGNRQQATGNGEDTPGSRLPVAGSQLPIGFVTSGLAFGYLAQALNELGLWGQYPVLKLGMSWPLDRKLVCELAGQCGKIIVVEERRDFLEEQIAEIILKERQANRPAGHVEVWGKQLPGGRIGFPITRGLHPSTVIERLVPVLQSTAEQQAAEPGTRNKGERSAICPTARPDSGLQVPPLPFPPPFQSAMQAIDATAQSPMPALPSRVPTFCPGCPHRDSAGVCMEIRNAFLDGQYMHRTHKCQPVDVVFHGDAGCYVLLMYPPNAGLMHDYSGMGLGGGTAVGNDKFITNKEVVFMGDGTFFHSGQLAVSQAIKLGQDITFVILDNSTTAMTGHQPTPGVEYDVIGNLTPVQDIEAIIGAMGEITLFRADPEKRKEYRRLLEETFLADGVKVVIATKECGITRTRRKRRAERVVAKRLGFLPAWEHMNVNTDVCRFCLACAETACPGLKHVQTEYGRKIDTDISWCVNDGACERLKACSSFERVTIKRKRPPKSRLPELGLDSIPDPPCKPLDPTNGIWQCCLTGVGGMGIGVATSILVRAGHKEGYEVAFYDKKGLAMRNGGTYSDVVYSTPGRPVTAIIPYGQADLLLGVDILEAARAIDPRGRARIASRDKTAAVINTDRIQTIPALIGQEDDFDPASLETLIRQYTRRDDFLARNISRICEKYLGSKLYSNIMMLGFAFQKGLIPVSMHSMAWAIKDTISTDIRKNLYAFNMGRKLVVQSDLFQGPPQRTDWREVLEDKCRYAIRRYGRRGPAMADQLRQLASATIDAMPKLDESLKRAVVVRTYDCMRWGGIEYARTYADAVRQTCKRDLEVHKYAATAAVIHNLANAMLIKDGPFIGELATSPEKYARDREKYNVNPANGDKIVYRHLLHPTFHVGPLAFAKDFALPSGMMRILRASRWLRKLPTWHAAERKFLDQYMRRVGEFVYSSAKEYEHQLRLLSSPRCMSCMNPTCRQRGCPLENNVPQCVQLAFEDRWQEAAATLLAANNFPEFTSRICPAFCQEECKQSYNGYCVQFQDIEFQIVERAFREGWIVPKPAQRKTGRKVAIVGSGPAGLAAAQQLARAGHDVTVFEKDLAVGGLLRYGIPAFRLEKELIDRRVEQLTAEGVKFKTGVSVGKDVSAYQLRNDFDAVLLATGANRSRDLSVPGRKLDGIHYAIDFLRQQAGANASAPAISAKDKIVAVIGGGLTGEDCVETALLQGAREVHQFEIMDKAPEKASGHVEEDSDKVTRRYCVSTRAFGGSGPKLTQLQGVQVRWLASAGGPVMQELPDSDFHVNIDMALLAMGFEPSADAAMAEQLGLGLDARGRLKINEYATTVPGVFAAGDALSGASYVATAIDSGRTVAKKIDDYLARL